MAEIKELLEVGVITPFPQWKGERTSTDKRCSNGRLPDVDTGKKDDKGNAIMKQGAIIKTNHKVRFELPVPVTDEDCMEIVKVKRAVVISAGMVQGFYSANKTDTYLAQVGTKDIDIRALTVLAEMDIPIIPREKKASETKQKAQKFDALKAKYDVSDDELEQILAHARKKKGK